MGTGVAIRQLCESAERRKLAWEATRRLYQLRKLVADLPKLVVNDPVGLADNAPTGPEALMWTPRELGSSGTIRCLRDGHSERRSP